MSRYVDYYCVKCKETANIHNCNRGEKTLLTLLTEKNSLRDLSRLSYSTNSDIHVTIDGYVIPVRFFFEHGNHLINVL